MLKERQRTSIRDKDVFLVKRKSLFGQSTKKHPVSNLRRQKEIAKENWTGNKTRCQHFWQSTMAQHTVIHIYQGKLMEEMVKV